METDSAGAAVAPADARNASARIGGLLTAVRGAGIFCVAGLLALLVGVTIHHFARLPRAYTWWGPFTTLGNIIGMPHVPLSALVVYALGSFARRGRWDRASIGAMLDRPLDRVRDHKKAIALGMASGLAMAMVDRVAFVDHTYVDSAVVAAVGSRLPSFARRPRALAELVVQAVIATLVFSILSYTYTIVKATVFQTNDPLDAHIVHLETALFGEPIHRKLARWTADAPDVVRWCDWVYNRFFIHMMLTTVLLYALRQHRERNEYLLALLLCYLFGGPLYHLCPAAGPVFFEPEVYSHLHRQPNLVTNHLHAILWRNTSLVAEGRAEILPTWSYVAAMPSLHIAHELVMTWYSRRSRIALALSATFTVATFASVMVLGWHYFSDTVAGAGLAVVVILIARKMPNAFMPSFVTASEDEEVPEARGEARGSRIG